MLRAVPTATALLLSAGGCLWEPIEEAAVPGNADAAPVIQKTLPNNHEVLVITSQHAPLCETQPITLESVFSPRGVGLTARFFLNYLDSSVPQEPLSIEGQTDFPLNASEGDQDVYSLPPVIVDLDDFVSQLSDQTNVLWVFVSDDFSQCPDPSQAIVTQQVSPSGTATLSCYTTSWAWVIDPNQCVLFNNL